MDLSIIIVNWNSKEHLRRCIASVLAWTSGIEYEIVVIDNGSFDGVDRMLSLRYPQVRFIQGRGNAGFARANNTAFRESRGEHILFLNPDTELAAPAVNILLDRLKSLPKAGVVGGMLLNADGSVQTSCIQAFPTILNQLLGAELLKRLFPASPLWGMAPLHGSRNVPAEVDVVSGACIMIPRMIFEQVGLFGEEYFMYAEDVDLCYKVRQAGYRNYFVPAASVTHFGGGSSQQNANDFSGVLMRESLRMFLSKTRGKRYGSAYRISLLPAAIGRIAVLLLLLPLSAVASRSGPLRASLRKWRAILRWSMEFGKESGSPAAPAR